jgi:hypothetical protein
VYVRENSAFSYRYYLGKPKDAGLLFYTMIPVPLTVNFSIHIYNDRNLVMRQVTEYISKFPVSN